MDFLSWFTNIAATLGYGYIGIFALSFAASLIVFVPIPYFIPVAVAAIFLDPNIVSLSSAVGATMAKVIIFRGAYLGRRFLHEDTRQRLRPFEKLVSKYGWIAAFIAAATPIPDDIVYIPLGFTKYSLWRFITATFIGKLTLTLFIAWGARLSVVHIRPFIHIETDPVFVIITTVILVAISLVTVFVILRLDWSRILKRWFPWTVDMLN